ncbi:MAG: transcription-repair coupling factor (superfamily II helicase) [Planctomycetota bacterium]|jgi:transcription-repair coupling factor (superfamily II helicase)
MARSYGFTTAVGKSSKALGVCCGNLIGSSAALFACSLSDQVKGSMILLTSTVGEAQGLAEDVTWFGSPKKVAYLPTSDESGFLAGAGESAFAKRLDIARDLGDPKSNTLVVSSITAFLAVLPQPKDLESSSLNLTVGEEKDREKLAARLELANFERVSHVEVPGQYALRGGIVDIFDHLALSPWRIELFGDEVESIRSFAPDTQRSFAKFPHVTLSLSSPHSLSSNEAEDGCRMPDLMHKDVTILLRDADGIAAHMDTRKEQRELSGRPDKADHRTALFGRSAFHLDRLPVGGDGVDFSITSVATGGNDMPAAIDALDRFSARDAAVVVCFVTEAEKTRFWAAVEEESEGLLFDSFNARKLSGVIGSLYRGFMWRDQSFSLVNHRELFNINIQRRRVRAEDAPLGRAIDDFVDLNPGDFVVHVAQGIGQFVGIDTIEKNGETQEFMTLRFDDDVLLYVPVAKADLVQRYIGGKGEEPKLSKIGGRSWAKKKDDVYKAVADLAAEMLETQAHRAKEEGFTYPPDGTWQHEFEASFPYEETPDQLTAVDAIKTDMESSKPMDRLICGDVGYGKTEVAMRAVFKAVMAGRQVAVLVPTTVLAEQHLSTFRERMADYPITVEGLSRFRSRKEQAETVVGLIEGRVDIVIGTHRLLSKDVQFNDLGLLIIDEEQRFGVAHKEKIRSIRRLIDILVLTATPIPRTLHLSLLGIRDISSLTQAPRGRQPVETKIVRYDEAQIRAAVLFELERGGQCFFVHNRVKTIERIKKDLRRIVPEASVLILHGQQPEKTIEANLVAFVAREADILLATTIIESGLDIPSANTIFIDRPDMYGLADLHQLRGRVGRYREKAHAYLLIRPDIILTGDAEKRIRAIEEFDDLGSGFRIAMRDLEIRGAGNLLGHQQSGHIAAVGYDMYCRLLDTAVKDLKKKRAVWPDEVDLNLNFEAFIPKTYIEDPKLKLEIYRKLGRSLSDSDFDEVLAEMKDRFGRPPEIVHEFLDVCRIRALAERFELKRVANSEGRGLLIRPGWMKSVLRRLLTSGVEHRSIGDKDVLLVAKSPLETPEQALRLLRESLVLEKE